MEKTLLTVLGWALLIPLAVLIFGPMCVGLLDALCWFAVGHGCTPVEWTPLRVFWAAAPAFVVVLAAGTA